MIKKYFKNESGVAAVEFALVAPILIFLIIGTVDIGFFVIERMKLENAAYAAADYAAQMADTSNVETIIGETYDSASNVTVTSTFTCECSDGVATTCPVACGGTDYQRRFVTISLDRNYSTLFPYPGLSDDLALRGEARLRVD